MQLEMNRVCWLRSSSTLPCSKSLIPNWSSFCVLRSAGDTQRQKKGTGSMTSATSSDLYFLEENGSLIEQEESVGKASAIEDASEKVQAMNINGDTRRKVGVLSGRKYGLWRREQKTRAARLEKQIKVHSELEFLIEEQLNRFHAHYNRAMIPTSLKDVVHLLLPKRAPPQELTALNWMGDWRPSAILNLIKGLAQSSSSSFISTVSDPIGAERLLSQLIHEVGIEEAIIDEEMAEIQARCIFHLPFSPVNSCRPSDTALSCIQAEFKKIVRVVTKAQELRFKALQLAVHKVLHPTDAAEFLVAFAGLQDLIHQFSVKQNSSKAPLVKPVNALGLC